MNYCNKPIVKIPGCALKIGHISMSSQEQKNAMAINFHHSLVLVDYILEYLIYV